jgi:hypothetical protein
MFNLFIQDATFKPLKFQYRTILWLVQTTFAVLEYATPDEWYSFSLKLNPEISAYACVNDVLGFTDDKILLLKQDSYTYSFFHLHVF